MILLLIVAFLLRASFLMVDNSDDQVHLWNIGQRRLLDSFFSHRVIGSVVPGKRGYPVLQHTLISRFPPRLWYWVAKGLNLFFDLLVIFLTYVVASWCLPTGDGSVSLPLLAAMLVAFLPLYHPLNSRLMAIGARTLGLLLVLLYLLALYGGMMGWGISWVIGAGLLVLIVMSSQFATQFALFTTMVLALLQGDGWLLLPLGILGVLVLIPSLGLRDILSFKIAHIRWYFRSQTGTTVQGRNSWQQHREMTKKFLQAPDTAMHYFLHHSSPFILFYQLPHLLLFILLAIANHGTFGALYAESTTFALAVDIVIATTLLFLLTSIPPLTIFGQAERYFEYAAPALILALLLLVTEAGVALAWPALLLYSLAIILFHLLYKNHQVLKAKLHLSLDLDSQELIDYLDQLSPKRIGVVPVKSAFWFWFHCQKPHHWYFRHINQPETGFTYFSDEMATLDLPKNLTDISERYELNGWVLDKQIKSEVLERFREEMGQWRSVFSNHRFEFYLRDVTNQMDQSSS